MKLRDDLRSLLEAGLIRAGTPRFHRRGHRREVLILAYHNVVPHGAHFGGDLARHLPAAMFARQLDALMRTHEIVPLADVLAYPWRAGRRPRAVITFDGGYVGALSVGIAELQRRDLPATVFVAPGLLGSDGFWWDTLAYDAALGDPTVLRAALIAETQGDREAVRRLAGERGWSLRAVPEHMRCVTHRQLDEAMRSSRLSVGSQTWTHRNLAALSIDDLVPELTRSSAWLTRHYGDRYLSAIAYPYGQTDELVCMAARATDHRAGLRGSGGWASPRCWAAHELPRLAVRADLSLSGFLLRAGGSALSRQAAENPAARQDATECARRRSAPRGS